MVKLVRAGRIPDDLPEGVRADWVTQAARDAGRRLDGLTSEERQELTRPRRENRVLREEREILAKAAAWLATETVRCHHGVSNS